jgi:hypothetical protein
VRSLGADVVVDYRQQDFAEVLSGYDVVLDPLGGEPTAKSSSRSTDHAACRPTPETRPIVETNGRQSQTPIPGQSAIWTLRHHLDGSTLCRATLSAWPGLTGWLVRCDS